MSTVPPAQSIESHLNKEMIMLSTVRTARVTGLCYLGLAVTGMVGFLLIRPMIIVVGDPGASAANLVDRTGVARAGLVLELAIVVMQALTAVCFAKLLCPINRFGGLAVAAFGMVNAAAIMISGAFLATAIGVAAEPALAPGGDVVATIALLHRLSANVWGVGAVFFGLWLVPMGYVAASSGRMPRLLGWIVMIGGAGYLLSSVIVNGFADAPRLLVAALTLPATVGELWMIGYLLSVGVRTARPHTASGDDQPRVGAGSHPLEPVADE